MVNIHATAIIEDGATIGNNVKIGAFCYIGSNVVLAENVEIKPHVVIDGNTTIGEGTVIYPFASIGLAPQDKKFKGEHSRLEIGCNNTIREYVNMHPGTESGGLLTRVGDNNLFMVGVHVAHDCLVGNNCVFANQATLAGHVVIEDFVTIGGLSGLHQFVRVGEHAMIGGMTAVEQDVIPYGVVIGERARLSGLNLIGLKRRGFTSTAINALREAYKTMFPSENEEACAPTFSERVSIVENRYSELPEVKLLIDFITKESHRNLCMPKKNVS